jgi:hypothetical protein
MTPPAPRNPLGAQTMLMGPGFHCRGVIPGMSGIEGCVGVDGVGVDG